MSPITTWKRGEPLRLSGVRVRRGEVEVLRGVDLEFEAGRRCVLVGASGSGKSTLLRLLNRLEDPAEGTLSLGSTPLQSFSIRTLRTHVGLVFQNPRPLPGTLSDNLAYPFEIQRLPRPRRAAMEASLDEFGLDPSSLDRDASELSGGERQRLAVAVALELEPEILALDEPTSGLDPASALRMADALTRRAREQGLRLIVVTHHREHARRLGDWAAVLDAGLKVDEGPVDEVLNRVDAALWNSADEHASDLTASSEDPRLLERAGHDSNEGLTR